MPVRKSLLRPSKPPALPEFIALMAMLSALVAFSIDAMLPALPAIAAELVPEAANRAQLVVGVFFFSLGIGTLFTGPLSDRFGRRAVLLGGIAIYMAGALLAWQSQSLAGLLGARMLQGLGAAGPRVVTASITRDMYAGRQMARIMSFIMIVFSLVPALAPLIGQAVTDAFGWRAIFLAFVGFAGLIGGWFLLRQPETLPPEARQPISTARLAAHLREILGHPTTRLSILVMVLAFAMLMLTLLSVQPVFDRTFGRASLFPFSFGVIAVLSTSAGFINARLVVRLGMRAMIRAMLGVQIGLSAIMLVTAFLAGNSDVAFAIYLVWNFSIFFQAGLTLGNLNALALEPMGHIAGTASSVVTASATVGSLLLAVPLGQAFDGTLRPIAAGVLAMAAAGFWLTGRIRRPDEL